MFAVRELFSQNIGNTYYITTFTNLTISFHQYQHLHRYNYYVWQVKAMEKGVVVWNLTVSEYVSVQPGDMIAFYFPGENPIPYTAYQCYSRKDQLRYISDPESMKVGETYTFGVAPLAMSACREYSIQTLVGK